MLLTKQILNKRINIMSKSKKLDDIVFYLVINTYFWLKIAIGQLNLSIY
jgi:hypothetical protein